MKYEPLAHFLRAEAGEVRALSFEEIERIIDAPLPPSARKHEAWWSNNPTGHVNAQAWLSAGYRAESIDISSEAVVFRKVSSPPRKARRHPAFGALAGSVRIMPGVDLTEPADPEWGGLYD
jgi:hypothetical protein